MASDLGLVELRGEVPREVVDVLDAVVAATPGASRMSVLRSVLGEWVARKKHEAMLIQRVARVTGSLTDTDRNRSGGLPS
jgi:hypothetical protein